MTLIDRFLTDTYTVTRSTSGQYKGGFYVPGPNQTLKVEGSLQPTNARELKMPEEGDRLRQYWKFYADTSLSTANTVSLAHPDIVTINGDTYKVISVETWQGIGVDLPYYKHIMYREPEN
jgi:hypothetical protein